MTNYFLFSIFAKRFLKKVWFLKAKSCLMFCFFSVFCASSFLSENREACIKTSRVWSTYYSDEKAPLFITQFLDNKKHVRTGSIYISNSYFHDFSATEWGGVLKIYDYNSSILIEETSFLKISSTTKCVVFALRAQHIVLSRMCGSKCKLESDTKELYGIFGQSNVTNVTTSINYMLDSSICDSYSPNGGDIFNPYCGLVKHTYVNFSFNACKQCCPIAYCPTFSGDCDACIVLYSQFYNNTDLETYLWIYFPENGNDKIINCNIMKNYQGREKHGSITAYSNLYIINSTIIDNTTPLMFKTTKCGMITLIDCNINDFKATVNISATNPANTSIFNDLDLMKSCNTFFIPFMPMHTCELFERRNDIIQRKVQL